MFAVAMKVQYMYMSDATSVANAFCTKRKRECKHFYTRLIRSNQVYGRCKRDCRTRARVVHTRVCARAHSFDNRATIFCCLKMIARLSIDGRQRAHS